MKAYTAKDILVRVIPSKIANDFVKKHHYSGKFVTNSCLHFGCFIQNVLHGVMSFGPSLDKSKTIGLVRDTKWNEFLELNRMAFDEALPKNSESRCISIAIKLIKKNAPQIRWIISFADGCQCGDGTIYRASGFVLTGIKKNKTIMEMPNGDIIADINLNLQLSTVKAKYDKMCGLDENGQYRASDYVKGGAKRLDGYQLRYIYFIDKTCKDKLTVPIIPFTEIDKIGAGMYKGEKVSREERHTKKQP